MRQSQAEPGGTHASLQRSGRQICKRARRQLAAATMAVTAMVMTSAPAQAQIRQQPMQRPDAGWWFSGGAAALVMGEINDGATQSVWRFGTDPLWQMRGTLERALDNSATIGVSVGYGKVDLQLEPFPLGVIPPTGGGENPVCFEGCDAQVDLYSLMAQFRSGGGPGFHTLFEASGGVTGFRGLRTRDTRENIGASKGQFDISGTLGAGFGYSLSNDLVIALVQDFGIGWHSKDNLPENASRSWRVRTTRASLRFAFGSRR